MQCSVGVRGSSINTNTNLYLLFVLFCCCLNPLYFFYFYLFFENCLPQLNPSNFKLIFFYCWFYFCTFDLKSGWREAHLIQNWGGGMFPCAVGCFYKVPVQLWLFLLLWPITFICFKPRAFRVTGPLV